MSEIDKYNITYWHVIFYSPHSSDVYLSLNGVIIPNHGYVIISDIGTAGDDTALLCHTNRPADIIGGTDGMHSGGQWFAPDRSEVLSGFSSVGFRRNRGSMVVRLYRNTGTTPVEGIYYCQIEDDTNMAHIVSVGLYNSVGGNVYTHACILCILISILYYLGIEEITVSDDVEFELITDSTFRLTCISTGGPATTVTWTRDNVTITEGTVTNYVSDDGSYDNILTVTERLVGLYTCTVANDRPSNDSANITVQGNNISTEYTTLNTVSIYLQLLLLPLM